MRIAALYDIHGNLPALEAVIADARLAGADHLLIGGDIFPGPMAHETLGYLRALDIPVQYIRGNGDRNLVEVAEGRESPGLPPALVPLFEWQLTQLDRSSLHVVAQWPSLAALSVGALGEVLFCHGTPRDDNEMFNVSTPAARIEPAFAGVSRRLVICGHTHRQFDRMVGEVRVVNAGSVGMPFGGTEAEWLLLGDAVELRRTAYDRVDAARRIMTTDYPRKDEFIQVALAPGHS